MNEVTRQFRDFFVSLKLTVWLLVLSIILIFWATLTQADLGVWGVQQKFFHSLFVLQKIPGTEFPFPVFPGGYLLGGFLFLNLICAQIYRFKLTWRKAGIWLVHLGLILLLIGELMSGLLQKDYDMTLDNGQTKNYSESERYNELAIIDKSDPNFDDVVAIPEELLAEGKTIQNPKLPFQVVTREYYPNSTILTATGQLQFRTNVPNAPPSLANQGFGQQLLATPLPTTGKEDDRNLPLAYVELIGPSGSLGVWMVTPAFDAIGIPQTFTYGGKEWKITLRYARKYLPFSVTLLKFSHDNYAGTNLEKNFSSRVRLNLPDGSKREVLIYMNNPLRYSGLTFFQHAFNNQDKTSILEVVRNPGWQTPYLACFLMAAGLVLQFCLHLAGFARRRRAAAVA